MNKLLQKLKEKEFLSNAWVTIPNAWTMEVLSSGGFDALCIDAQHGLATDLSTILPMLQSVSNGDSAILVRMPSIDPAFAMRMLDAGVDALIAPMIKTAEETEFFVQACFYPPLGYRSYGPLRAGKMHANYLENSRHLVCPMVMVETKEALDNIEKIAAVKGLKGLYLGPWDLSLDLGLSPLADFENPVLLKAIHKIVSTAHKNGLFVALHCASPEEGLAMRKHGFRLLTIYNDSRALQESALAATLKFKTPHL